MSYETWAAEFYPVEASSATGSALEAAEHSLRKWIGLRKENRERHGLASNYKDVHEVTDGEADAIPYLLINGESCALCGIVCGRCSRCPLEDARDGYACDVRKPSENSSPYAHYGYTFDPEPMIRDLEATVAMLRAREGK